LIQRGLEVSTVQLPEGPRHIPNSWLEFNDVKMEEQMAKGKKSKDEAKDEAKEEKADATPAQPIVGRHGKVAVLVNGDSYDSVRKAFAELKLPVKEKSRVRRSLRDTGKAQVKYNDTEYNFVRMDGDKEEK
jgi:TPP-dependent indolepyruvate ferredoxin oxidoreductase alpha subunit